MGQFVISADFISNALMNPLCNQKCSNLHQGSCNWKALQQFNNGCKGVYKMYLLVHLVPLLTIKRKRLIKDPKNQLVKLVLGFAKSLLFAGGYSMLVRRIVCFLTQVYSYHSVIGYIAGVLAGLSLIFEPIGRQSQIALYTLNKSMEVLYNMAIRRKIPVKLPKGECILTGISISILSYVYASDSTTFRDNYRKVIDQLMKDI